MVIIDLELLTMMAYFLDGAAIVKSKIGLMFESGGMVIATHQIGENLSGR
jgi:hypothetical protein